MTIDDLRQDARHVARQIRRAPGITVTAIGVITLAIGAHLTTLSLLNAVSLRPIAAADPDRLIEIHALDASGAQPRSLYYSTFVELRQHPDFEFAALYAGGGVQWIEARGVVGEGAIEAATPGFHEGLGLRPFLGRFFDAADAPADTVPAAVAVISHRFWRRYFGSDPNVIGELLLINKTPFTVIGVTPEDYAGLFIETGVDFAIPISALGRLLGTNQYPLDPRLPLRGQYVVARLKHGVAIESIRAAITASWSSLRLAAAPPSLPRELGTDLAKQQIAVGSLRAGFSTLRARYARQLRLLTVVTALFIAIAVLNLTGLVLAQHTAREREFVLHLTLGASGGRLLRQSLLETIGLSLVGTTAGIAIGWRGAEWATAILWESPLPLSISTMPDGRVISVTLGIGLIVGAVMGMTPWLPSRRARLVLTGGRTLTPRDQPWHRRLLAAQVALTVVVTTLAVLFVTTLVSLRGLDLGVSGTGLRWTRVLQQPGGYQGIRDDSYYPELVRRIAAVPGIESVALSHHFPAFFNYPDLVTTFPAAPTESADGAAIDVLMESVSPQFFSTAGIGMIRGRDFSWADDRTQPGVVIVNETLARAFGGDAVGRRIRIGDDPQRRALEIIAVVRDATIGGYRSTHQPVAFRPQLQEPRFARVPVVLYRSALPPAAADRLVSETVQAMGREYVRRAYGFDEQIGIALIRERLVAGSAVTLAGLALILGAVGLFAIVAHGVMRRTREFAVRQAIGASPRQLRWSVIRESAGIVLRGLALGLPASLMATRLVQTLLFGVSAITLPVFLGVSVGFVMLVALGSVIPAWRASSVAPAAALRSPD